jgi:hypothetical protein
MRGALYFDNVKLIICKGINRYQCSNRGTTCAHHLVSQIYLEQLNSADTIENVIYHINISNYIKKDVNYRHGNRKVLKRGSCLGPVGHRLDYDSRWGPFGIGQTRRTYWLPIHLHRRDLRVPALRLQPVVRIAHQSKVEVNCHMVD